MKTTADAGAQKGSKPDPRTGNACATFGNEQKFGDQGAVNSIVAGWLSATPSAFAQTVAGPAVSETTRTV